MAVSSSTVRARGSALSISCRRKTLAEELVRALSAAADNEQRWALTTAGHVALESAAV